MYKSTIFPLPKYNLLFTEISRKLAEFSCGQYNVKRIKM